MRTTPFGPVAVVWTSAGGRPRLTAVVLSQAGLSAEKRVSELFPDAGASACPAIDAVCSDITASLNGRSVRFSLGLVQLDLCPPFQQEVLRANCRIPRGSVSTYGLLATHLGRPGAARAVGNALAGNPFPIVIPCHRVIRSDRIPGGYGGGRWMKRTLLKGEGVKFDSGGRIMPDSMHYGSS